MVGAYMPKSASCSTLCGAPVPPQVLVESMVSTTRGRRW